MFKDSSGMAVNRKLETAFLNHVSSELTNSYIGGFFMVLTGPKSVLLLLK